VTPARSTNAWIHKGRSNASLVGGRHDTFPGRGATISSAPRPPVPCQTTWTRQIPAASWCSARASSCAQGASRLDQALAHPDDCRLGNNAIRVPTRVGVLRRPSLPHATTTGCAALVSDETA
jgi:hypothetical protein